MLISMRENMKCFWHSKVSSSEEITFEHAVFMSSIKLSCAYAFFCAMVPNWEYNILLLKRMTLNILDKI